MLRDGSAVWHADGFGMGTQWNRVLIAPFCVLKFIFMPRGRSGTLRPRLAPVQSWMGSAKSI